MSLPSSSFLALPTHGTQVWYAAPRVLVPKKAARQRVCLFLRALYESNSPRFDAISGPSYTQVRKATGVPTKGTWAS